jgi:Ca-activated chloride channel family protein
MRLERFVSWWILIPYIVVAAGAAGWQIWQIRHAGRRIVVRWSRRALLVLLPAVLALGPSVPGGTSAPGVSNLDVVVAIDTTPSMGALDYAGTQQRLAGVKKDVLALAGKLQGARLEVITFDSDADVILPFTNDQTAFASAVNGLTPQASGYSQGSAIDKPVTLITEELKSSKALYPQHQRLLFYLGDGEQTSSAAVSSFAPIAPYLNGGAVLGYGTTVGAKMINYTITSTPGSTLTYISTVDPSSNKLEPAISKLSPTALTLIASQLKVPYQDRDLGGSINGVYQASKIPLTVDHSQHIVRYLNLYWLVAIPLVGLIFWEWQALVVKLFGIREPREKKSDKHA